MEEQKNHKRVLSIELDDNVKRVSITVMGSDEKVVMKQELDENQLDMVTGGLVYDEESVHKLTDNFKGLEYELTEIWPD